MVRLFIGITFLFSLTAQSQSIGYFSLAPASATISTSTVRAIWNIGEIVKGTAGSETAIVKQGIISNTSLLRITSLDPLADNLLFESYPNPTSSNFVIKWKSEELKEGVKYNLFDSKGTVHSNLIIDDFMNEDHIELATYKPGIYILIIEGDKLQSPIKLKIVKTYSHE